MVVARQRPLGNPYAITLRNRAVALNSDAGTGGVDDRTIRSTSAGMGTFTGSSLPVMARTNAGGAQGASVNSLRRGLSVLGCFGQDTARLSLAQIAEATGLSAPTVWRYCYTLRKLRYLVRHSDESLSIGLPALGLGFAAISNRPFSETVLPHLQDLADRFGCTAILGQAMGTEVTYLQMISGRITFAEFQLGRRAPLVESPTGWGCLASMSQGERSKALAPRSARPRLPAGFGVVKAEFEARGYMVTKGLPHPALVAVSVPIRLHDTAPIYTLTCGGHAASMAAAIRGDIGMALLALRRASLDYLAGLEAAAGMPGMGPAPRTWSTKATGSDGASSARQATNPSGRTRTNRRA